MTGIEKIRDQSTELHITEPTLWMRAKWFLEDLEHKYRARWMKFCDKMKYLGHKPSNLESHAKKELELAGFFDETGDYGPAMGHAVLDMIRQFSIEGHSGFSASVAVGLFQKLARFEPLNPLTGDDREFIEVGHHFREHEEKMIKVRVFQNTRCSRVFREIHDDGTVLNYDIEGKVFREPSGVQFTSYESRVPVIYPYSPKTEYVDVKEPTNE